MKNGSILYFINDFYFLSHPTCGTLCHLEKLSTERLESRGPCWNWGEWGLKEYKCKGFFLGWFFGLVVTARDLCSALAALVSTVQNIFFHNVYYSISIPFSPSPSKLGRQPGWVACLSGVSGFQNAELGFERKPKARTACCRLTNIGLNNERKKKPICWWWFLLTVLLVIYFMGKFKKK